MQRVKDQAWLFYDFCWASRLWLLLLIPKHLFPEVASLFYLSFSQNAKMLQYFPWRDITVPHMDVSDLSSSVFLLWYSYSLVMSRVDLSSFCVCLVTPNSPILNPPSTSRADAFLMSKRCGALTVLLSPFKFFRIILHDCNYSNDFCNLTLFFFFWFSFYTELNLNA